MGLCADRSVNYLKTLGLNTIQHPRAGIEPLMLIGEFGDSIGIIGTLDQLVEPSTVPLPDIETDDSSNISGKRSSKLPISLGLDILGSVIGALGGNLGIKAFYEQARTVEFKFLNVKRHLANVVKIGDFLDAGEVRWDHMVLKKYLQGKGNLYVITEVATSDQLGVSAFDKNKASISLDVPVIDEVVGGNVCVGMEDEVTNTVVFKGGKQLAFGFSAIELSAVESENGDELVLDFTPVPAGGVAMAMGQRASSGQVWFDAQGAQGDLPDLDIESVG